MRIVAVSGYFDPLHVGHIEYFRKSRELGDRLIVILNNDEQIIRKKGKCFMPAEERKKILEALRDVDEVFLCIDEDRSVCKSLETVHELFGVNIFTNGGDRTQGGVTKSWKDSTDIPEVSICEKLGIEIVDGIGEKIQSSSHLIKKSEENGN